MLLFVTSFAYGLPHAQIRTEKIKFTIEEFQPSIKEVKNRNH